MKAACPQCKATINVDDGKFRGGKVTLRCPNCHQNFSLSKAPKAAAPASSENSSNDESNPFWTPEAVGNEPAQANLTDPTPAPPPTPANQSNYWDQLQSMDGPGDSTESKPSEKELIKFDENKLLEGLAAEKARVNEELRRLDGISGNPDVVEAIDPSDPFQTKRAPRKQPPQVQSTPVATVPGPREQAIELQGNLDFVQETSAPKPPPASSSRVQQMRTESSAPKPRPRPVAKSRTAESSVPKMAPVALPTKPAKGKVTFTLGQIFLVGGIFVFGVIVIGGLLVVFAVRKHQVQPDLSGAGDKVVESVTPPIPQTKTAPKMPETIVTTTPDAPKSAVGSSTAVVATTTPQGSFVDNVNKGPFESGLELYAQHSLEGYRQAEEQLRKAYDQEAKSPRVAAALSELYSALGDRTGNDKLIKQAFDLAQFAVASGKEPAKGQRALAQAYLAANQFALALGAIQKSLAVDPQDKESYLIRGMILRESGKGGAGLREAFGKDPNSFRAINELGEFLLKAKQIGEADKMARRLLELFPARVEGHALTMRVAVLNRDFNTAAQAAQQVLMLGAQDIELLTDVAKIYLEMGRDKEANDLLEVQLATVGKLPKSRLVEVYSILGKANLKSSPTRAVFYFQKVVGFEPNDISALNYLGLSYFNSEDYKNSAQYYGKALRLSPKSTQIKYNLALAYYKARSLNGALQVFQEVVAQDKNHEMAHFYIASIFEQQGDRMKAIDSYQEALRLNPTNLMAREKLGRLKSGSN